MRTKPTSYRGLLGIIRKGTGHVVAVAELVDSPPALDQAAFAAARHKHGIQANMDAEVLKAGWVCPWVLRNVRRLRQPVLAGQKSGQVIWVPLSVEAEAAVVAQTGSDRLEGVLEGVQ